MGFGPNTYKLTASEAVAEIEAGTLTVENYASALLDRIQERDSQVEAWAYLDREYVLKQARYLDKVPIDQRGPLHGVAVGVKDVIYTKDMPTQHNSPIYAGSITQIDAGSIMILRKAGALIFGTESKFYTVRKREKAYMRGPGKTTTTEFAAVTKGSKTRNPHDPNRTPGGSSSGSGAAVGDSQVPIGLGTQTGGSTIRPASFNGIYALKPTWNSITREGQKIYSLILDTLGLYARSVDDLQLLARVFDLKDDEPPPTQFTVKGAKFGFMKTVSWGKAGPGTKAAMETAKDLLMAHEADVEEIELPEDLSDLLTWHETVLYSDGRPAFLPEYRVAKEQLSEFLKGHVENLHQHSHAEQLKAFDSIAAARPRVDEILAKYAAVITPSVPDEAPVGIDGTGSAVFNCIWTALHTPVVNIPGFKGDNGMPIGLSLVAPRYRDQKLLAVCKSVGEIFENEGGWRR